MYAHTMMGSFQVGSITVALKNITLSVRGLHTSVRDFSNPVVLTPMLFKNSHLFPKIA